MTKTGNTSCDNKDIRDTGCEPEYKKSLRVKLVSKEPDKNDTQQANRQDTHSLLFSSPYSVLAATTQFGTAPHGKCRRFYHGEKKKQPLILSVVKRAKTPGKPLMLQCPLLARVPPCNTTTVKHLVFRISH